MFKFKPVIAGLAFIILTVGVLFVLNRVGNETPVSEPNKLNPNLDNSPNHSISEHEPDEKPFDFDPPIQKNNAQFEDLRETFIAPSFMNDDLIAFEMDHSDKELSYIGTVARDNEEVKIIYQTDKNKIINSLVGVDKWLYWVEYDRYRQKDMPWIIKSYDIITGETNTVASGVGEDQIDPPVLRVYDNKVTWIEKEIKNQIVYSNAIIYDPISQTNTKLSTVRLNEQQKERQGEFFIIQRPIEDGLLIYQSVFKPGTDKTFEIVFYPYSQSENPVSVIQKQGIIDFNGDKKWFVYTEDERIHVMDRLTGDVKFVIHEDGKDLSYDSPFIFNDILYYRYSMEQIMAFDFETESKKGHYAIRCSYV